MEVTVSANFTGQQETIGVDETARDVFAKMRATGDRIAAEFQERGRDQISKAGNFGSRWTEGFKVTVTDDGQSTVVVTATEDVPYWRIHEYGGVIRGHPLLWIPFSGEERGSGGGGKYVVNKRGLPLIIDLKLRKPVRFGKTSVTIKPKFGLRDLADELMDKASSLIDRAVGGF